MPPNSSESTQTAGEPKLLRPLHVSPDRVLALSDPLLRCAAPIVEGHHPLRRAAQVRDQKAHSGIEFSRMSLHLGHDPAGAAPRLGLVAAAGEGAPDLMRGTAHRAREQMRNAATW